jgi:hypothetical protein
MNMSDSLDQSTIAKVSGAILDSLDKYTIAKVSGAILAFYGTIMFLAPQKARDLYGTKDVQLKDPKSPLVLESLVQRGALAFVTGPAMWYLHVDAGLSREKAAGVCLLPSILFCLHSLLNEIPKQMGSSVRVDISCLMIYIPVAYATLSGVSSYYSDLALKSLWGWTLANGLLLYMTPSAIDTLYDIPEREEFVLLERTIYGANLINVALFGGAFAWGMDDAKAVGLGWASAFVTTLLNVKQFQKFNVATGPIYIWLALMAFFAITLLL